MRVLAAGPSEEVRRHPGAGGRGVEVVERPGSVLMPGLVNAHTHLDLTHLGPRPHDPGAGFVPWVEMIRQGRHADEAAIAASVARGARLSLLAGTVAVGDIGGAVRGRPSLAPWRALRSTGMRGVSFLEYFGIGSTARRSRAAVAEVLASASREASGRGAALGLQPHAPNTVSTWLYGESVELARGEPARPLATHLAETPEERVFVARGTGPQRALLERLGLWEDAILGDVGRGLDPVAHLAPVLALTPMLLAHVNDADDAAIRTLARSRASVVYCPHASAYFAAERHFGGHRYREMLDAGVNVALGTDSIVNLPRGSERTPSPGRAEADAGRGMSILGEMRMLGERDGADPVTLLRMATVNGARALGLTEQAFVLGAGGPLAGLIGVDVGPAGVAGAAAAVRGAMGAGMGPEILFADKYSGLVGTLGDGFGPEA